LEIINTDKLEFIETYISELLLLQRETKGDSRGYLERLFCQEKMGAFLNGRSIRQINHTHTRNAGTVRGMHFQYPPHSELKIVTCLKGRVWDVAIDLRENSPTFLNHFSTELSEENHRSLIIPEGFAHGFQTLVSDSELIYFHTADYNPESEGALNALDRALAINWPLPIHERSLKDEQHPFLNENFKGIKI
jgi:dTDP-4-dehydrorhamnose 3,5-epimerase